MFDITRLAYFKRSSFNPKHVGCRFNIACFEHSRGRIGISEDNYAPDTGSNFAE